MALTNTAPASIPSMHRAISASSSAHTLEPSPKVVALAASMAASTSGTRITMATGPKISSWAIGMSVVIPERTVGANHQPSPSGSLAPAWTVAPWRRRLLHLAHQLVALRLADDRPDVGGGVEGVAHDQRVHRLDEAGLELVGHRVDDDEALGRDARLAVVLHAGGHGGAHGVVEVGRLASTMKGSEPPSSSTRLLQGVAGGRRHRHAGRLAAGQGHRGDARVVDQRGDVARRRRRGW